MKMGHMNSSTPVMKLALILQHINQKHEEESASHFKRSEEWMMILACCNTPGNNKLEFVAIEKSPPTPKKNIYICIYNFAGTKL